MINYFYDCYTILNKVYSEKAYLKQAIGSTVIEEKNRPLTIKTCYGVLDKDIELSYYIKSLTEKSPKLVIRTILKIAMYAIKYLGKSDYAVIDNAVELTKKLGKKGASGFVNAILRKFTNTEIALPTDRIKNLSVKYSYPEFAVKLLERDYKEESIRIMAYDESDTTVVFYGENGDDYLKSRGLIYEKQPFTNAFSVKNFVRNADYDRGVYTFQSIGSNAICDIVEPCKKLLDACAAPGGKSVNLSRKIKEIVSCDIHEHRVNLIKEYAKRMKADNVTALLQDATVFNPEFEGEFDAVLCDVPCSGFGVIKDNPDIKLNKDFKNIEELIKIQREILVNCCKYVKVGGYLYYSTCSVFQMENSENAEYFLLNNLNYSLVDIDSPLEHIKVKNGLQFLPHISRGAGFYIAKFRRNA